MNLAVHPQDEMFTFFLYGHGSDQDRAILLYLSSGAALWSTIRQVLEWRFGSLDNVGRLLDFASGFGRVTRFMVAELPRERIWISDIYPDAVDFQARELGVHAFLSTAQPEQLSCAERFDAIVVSSLFTHLPAATFEGWLRKLGSLLNPGGLLMFSVHGEHLLDRSEDLPENGILFREVSESTTLPKQQYGTSWVSEAFVQDAVRSAIGECSIRRVPRGFANFQDLFIVLEGEASCLPPLKLERQADGFLERSDLVDGTSLRLEGWVADRHSGSAPREVRVHLDGALRARTTKLSSRPDVEAAFPGDQGQVRGGGFSVEVELASGWPPAAPLAVTVVDGSGEEATLYADRLEAALLRSTRLELLRRDEQTRQLEEAERRFSELEVRAAAAQEAAAELQRRSEATIAWMEASRFWKLRNGWFALKRFLRLTTER